MNQQHASMPQSAQTEGQSLDTIRKLLLGDQFDQISTRFAQMERGFSARLEKMQAEFQGALSEVKSQVKVDLASYKTLLDDEIRVRSDSFARLDSSLQVHKGSVASLMESMGTRFDKLTAIVQSKLDILQSRIDKSRQELEGAFRDQTRGLQDKALSRSEFTSLLSELQQRIQKNSPAPSQPTPPARTPHLQDTVILENIPSIRTVRHPA